LNKLRSFVERSAVDFDDDIEDVATDLDDVADYEDLDIVDPKKTEPIIIDED
jgi:hypothetical protein